MSKTLLGSCSEFEKCRIMRIGQVRQQAKDIAEGIRNRVREKSSKVKSKIEERSEQEIKIWQARKLLEVKNQYDDALSNFGIGQKAAVYQNEEESLKQQQQENNDKIAKARGIQAATKLQIDKNERNYQKALPLQQKKLSRDVENIRSTEVSNMQKNKQTPINNSPCTSKENKSNPKSPLPMIGENDENSADSNEELCECCLAAIENVLRDPRKHEHQQQLTNERENRAMSNGHFPSETRISERIKNRNVQSFVEAECSQNESDECFDCTCGNEIVEKSRSDSNVRATASGAHAERIDGTQCEHVISSRPPKVTLRSSKRYDLIPICNCKCASDTITGINTGTKTTLRHKGVRRTTLVSKQPELHKDPHTMITLKSSKPFGVSESTIQGSKKTTAGHDQQLIDQITSKTSKISGINDSNIQTSKKTHSHDHIGSGVSKEYIPSSQQHFDDDDDDEMILKNTKATQISDTNIHNNKKTSSQSKVDVAASQDQSNDQILSESKQASQILDSAVQRNGKKHRKNTRHSKDLDPGSHHQMRSKYTGKPTGRDDVNTSSGKKTHYYDRKNRFSKDYVSDVRVEKITDNDLIIQSNGESETDMLEKMEMRNREAEIRGQRALEKEMSQRAYLDLVRKLPLLQKQERIWDISKDRPEYHMSEDRLRDLKIRKQCQLDNKYEQWFPDTRPAVVTLPKKCPQYIERMRPVNVDNNASSYLNLINRQNSLDHIESTEQKQQLIKMLNDLKKQKGELFREYEFLENSKPMTSLGVDYSQQLNDERGRIVSKRKTRPTTDTAEQKPEKDKLSNINKRKPRVETDSSDEANDKNEEIPEEIEVSENNKRKHNIKRSSKQDHLQKQGDKRRILKEVESNQSNKRKSDLAKEDNSRTKKQKSDGSIKYTIPDKSKRKLKKKRSVLQNIGTQTTPQSTKPQSVEESSSSKVSDQDLEQTSNNGVKQVSSEEPTRTSSEDQKQQISQNNSKQTLNKDNLEYYYYEKKGEATDADVCQIVINLKEYATPEVVINQSAQPAIAEMPKTKEEDKRRSPVSPKSAPAVGDNISETMKENKTTDSTLMEKNKNSHRSSWREQFGQNSSFSTTVTSYFSPPNSNKKNAKSNGIDSDNRLTSKKEVDLQLLNYIKHLLRKSPSSIDNLSLSTVSEVSTPSQSIVENEANVNLPPLEQILKAFNLNKDDLKRDLKHFKKATLKYTTCENVTITSSSNSSHSISSSSSSSKSNNTTSSGNNVQSEGVENSLKTSQKKEKSKTITSSSSSSNLNHLSYIERTYNKKICNIDAMIQRVREEKKRMLESPNYSSESDNDTTKYLDCGEMNEKQQVNVGDDELSNGLLSIDLDYAEQLKHLNADQIAAEKKRIRYTLDDDDDDNDDDENANKNGNLDQELIDRFNRLRDSASYLISTSDKQLFEQQQQQQQQSDPVLWLNIPKGSKVGTGEYKKYPPISKGLTRAKRYNENIVGVPHELSTIVEGDSQLSKPGSRRSSLDDVADGKTMTKRASSNVAAAIVGSDEKLVSEHRIISSSDTSSKSSSDKSDVELTEAMLIDIGMDWAVPILKKTKQSLALSSSSGSFELEGTNSNASKDDNKISSSSMKSGTSPTNLLQEFQDLSDIHFSDKDHHLTSTPVDRETNIETMKRLAATSSSSSSSSSSSNSEKL